MDNFSFPKGRHQRFRRFAKIRATAVHLPEQSVTNQEIIDQNGIPVPDKVIQRNLGVKVRRVAAPGTADSDLLAAAGRSCLARAGVEPDRLSRILVTKFLGDRLLPMTAAQVQKKTGCTTAIPGFDVDGGINGFLQALDMGLHYINSGEEYVLILSGGVIRCLTSQTDPRTAFLFGDGAAAVLLEKSDRPHFMGGYFYANPSYYDLSIAFGKLTEIKGESFRNKDFSFAHDLYAPGNWKDIAPFYREAACVIKDRLMQNPGVEDRPPDWVLVTENNHQIRQMTLEALDVSPDKSLSVIAQYGNTMSAMLPILLNKGFDENLFRPGDNIMLISHGEGASGGGMIYSV